MTPGLIEKGLLLEDKQPPKTRGKQVPGTYILPLLIVLIAEILHQLRLVVYPIIYDVFYTSQVLTRIYEPSTAS